MKKTWWRVPVYCLAASWICFHLEVHWLLRFAIVTLPDGSISSDSTRSLIIYGILFFAVLLIGGLLFFRKISRKELLLSAFLMIVLDFYMMLKAWNDQGLLAFYWAELTEWSIFISQLFYMLGMDLENLLPRVLRALAPLLFVAFGRGWNPVAAVKAEKLPEQQTDKQED